MNLKKYLILVSQIIILTAGYSEAQDKTLYFMGINPAGNMLNPAYTFNRSVVILNPSFDLSLTNSALTFNNIIKKGTGTGASKFYWDFDHIEQKLKPTNLVYTNGSVNLLFAGKRLPKGQYLSLGISKKFDLRISYPESFARLRYGNADFNTGKPRTIDLNNYFAEGSVYNEFTFGYSKIFSDRFYGGFHVKLLTGDIGIHTSRFKASVKTTNDFSASYLETDALVKISAPVVITRGEGNELDIDREETDKLASMQPFSLRNYGTGIDLGCIWKINERISLAASVLDLGFINWTRKPQQLASKGSYVFDGFYFSAGDLGEFDSDSVFQPYLDTLLSVFTPSLSDGSFITYLTAKSYLGIKYRMNTSITFNALLKTTRLYDELYLEATGGLIYTPWKRWSFSGTWSYSQYSFYNAGLGIVFNGDRFQVYAATDNLNTLDLLNSKGINLSMGINWIVFEGK